METLQIPNEIKDFYDQLEDITSFDYWDLSIKLDPLKEVYTYDWRNALTTEQLCTRFFLSNGNLRSVFESVDVEGKIKGFPEINNFNEKHIDYLTKRIEDVKNPLLISRYNHILFAITKHSKYAAQATNAYKNILRLKLNDETQSDIISSIEAILRLTEKTKYELEKTKEELIAYLNNTKLELYIKNHIIEVLIKSKLFKSNELAFFPELCLELLKDDADPDYHTKSGLLNSAIKLCINNALDTNIFYEKLAENEDWLLVQHQEDEDFLKSIILGKQMEYYKKANNLEKYEAKRKEYTEAKAKIKLQLIEQPLGKNLQRILNQEIQRNVKIMMRWPSEKIFNYFSHHGQLFPDIQTVIKSAIARYDKSILKHISLNVFDTNVNAKNLNDEEGRQKQIVDDYFTSLGISVLPELLQVLNFGIVNNKTTYAKLYNYLKDNTWYGQNLPKAAMKNNKGKDHYNWLEFMAPALHHFYLQFENSFLIGTSEPYTNYILAMDSLTLKFEGALRDFVRLVGGSTSVLKKGEIQEMLLEDLLESETVKKEFSENDITLFKIVFTKMGENTRNNIAHCFYMLENYTMERMLRILLCILRLGKYKLKPKVENE
jgi:hypothetical protein